MRNWIRIVGLAGAIALTASCSGDTAEPTLALETTVPAIEQDHPDPPVEDETLPPTDVAPPTTGIDEEENGGEEEPEFVQRPGFPANPDDPEPLGSTGGDAKTDIIRTTDRSAFSCLVYLGRGSEEILDPTKSFYETHPDAFLFTSYFSDGTEIDIRVHPDFATVDTATAEVGRYTTALGQLPTVLRQEVGRFAISHGEETATASHLEGISVQSGNIDIRVADNRLEETLFHESVHTALDSEYSYMQSQGWLYAQEADGRFLTEYGRENPDSEDLAESALYAFAVLHYPERVPEALREAIEDRIPNRVEFISQFFPPGQPFISEGVEPPACGT